MSGYRNVEGDAGASSNFGSPLLKRNYALPMEPWWLQLSMWRWLCTISAEAGFDMRSVEAYALRNLTGTHPLRARLVGRVQLLGPPTLFLWSATRSFVADHGISVRAGRRPQLSDKGAMKQCN